MPGRLPCDPIKLLCGVALGTWLYWFDAVADLPVLCMQHQPGVNGEGPVHAVEVVEVGFVNWLNGQDAGLWRLPCGNAILQRFHW
jgi:hypothetical protein